MESEHERCTICKRAFKGGEELMKHIQEDHNRKKCPKCEKMIAANLMERHSDEHITREKIYKSKKVKKPTTTATKGKNPYHEFCRQERPKIKQDHPLYNLGQVNAELGRRWKGLTDEEKEDYRGNGGDGEAGAAAERQDGGDAELRNTTEREIDEVVINAFFDECCIVVFVETCS